MTSKQALLEIYLEAQSNQFHFSTEELVERVNKINNDLELLELLKNIIDVHCVERKRKNLYILASKNLSLTEEEYFKIKGWLNNERK